MIDQTSPALSDDEMRDTLDMIAPSWPRSLTALMRKQARWTG